MWKSEGLDLLMSPYGCISTGDEVGMIEVVQNSATTADITRKSGGATAVLKKYSIAQWLSEHNPGGRNSI
jgi:phosphatidylinositol-4,5-bisphosphate 3-kinase